MFRGASVAAAEKISWFSKTTQKKKNLLSLKPSDFLDKDSHFTSQNTGGADLLCNFGVLSPMTVLSEVKLLFLLTVRPFSVASNIFLLTLSMALHEGLQTS